MGRRNRMLGLADDEIVSSGSHGADDFQLNLSARDKFHLISYSVRSRLGAPLDILIAKRAHLLASLALAASLYLLLFGWQAAHAQYRQGYAPPVEANLHYFVDGHDITAGTCRDNLISPHLVELDGCGSYGCAERGTSCGPYGCAARNASCGPYGCAVPEGSCGPYGCSVQGGSCGPYGCSVPGGSCGPNGCTTPNGHKIPSANIKCNLKARNAAANRR